MKKFRLWFAGSVSSRSDYGCYDTIDAAKAATATFDDFSRIIRWEDNDRVDDIVVCHAFADYGITKLQILDEHLYQERMALRNYVPTDEDRAKMGNFGAEWIGDDNERRIAVIEKELAEFKRKLKE